MGRYARLRNFKYLAYPFFLERMVAAAARETKFDLLFSQHAISAVAAGKLKKETRRARGDEFSRPAHRLHGNVAGLRRAEAAGPAR